MKRAILCMALILVMVLAGCGKPQAATLGADGDSNFTNIVTDGDITVGDDLTVTDDTVFTDDVEINGDITLENDETISNSTDGTVAVTVAAAAGSLNVLVGNLAVGNGTPSTTQDGEDAYVEGGFEVDGITNMDGNLDLDATTVEIDLSGAMSIDVDLASNINAAAGDITVEAETGSVIIKGDEAVADAISLDANDAAGTGITAVVGSAGTFGVTGYIADFNMTGGVSIDADLASNFSASVGDITIEAETGSIILKGDEAAADSVYIDADEDAASGLDIDVGATNGVSIDGGMLDVGTGSYTTADGDNDLGVAGDLEVDGATDLDGALSVAGASTLASDLTVSAEATGGNAGAKNEISGLPRIKLVALSTMTNGTTETTSYVDDSPTGEYAPMGGNVTEAEGSVDGIYRFGASSYKAAFADAAAQDEGFKATIAGDDLEANESIGMWLYSSVSIASGDLQILLTDDGGARNYPIGAIAPTTWTWVEVDISALNGGTGDVVSEFGVTLTAQGVAALGDFNLYLESAWKWDASDEEALGTAILQDGVLTVMAVTDAQDQTNTQSILAENTGYFVHYEAGSDFIVSVADNSALSAVALIAY